MAYTEPKIIAQNNESGSYAAGCPAQKTAYGWCKSCERTQQAVSFIFTTHIFFRVDVLCVWRAKPCHVKQSGLILCFWEEIMTDKIEYAIKKTTFIGSEDTDEGGCSEKFEEELVEITKEEYAKHRSDYIKNTTKAMYKQFTPSTNPPTGRQ